MTKTELLRKQLNSLLGTSECILSNPDIVKQSLEIELLLTQEMNAYSQAS